jgi:acetyltransferase-like isoleucine patch superfamily enzyme
MIKGTIKAKFCRAESFGKRAVMAGKVRLDLRGKAVFGDRFRAEGISAPIIIKVERKAKLTIGNNVYMNGGVWIEAWHEMKIGDDVLFGPYVSLIDDDRHDIEPCTQPYKGPLIIGDNAWLGRNVAVMPGVHIGVGSVIGANSVVTRDIPSNSFAAGVPARVIKTLHLPLGWTRK